MWLRVVVTATLFVFLVKRETTKLPAVGKWVNKSVYLYNDVLYLS